MASQSSSREARAGFASVTNTAHASADSSVKWSSQGGRNGAGRRGSVTRGDEVPVTEDSGAPLSNRGVAAHPESPITNESLSHRQSVARASSSRPVARCRRLPTLYGRSRQDFLGENRLGPPAHGLDPDDLELLAGKASHQSRDIPRSVAQRPPRKPVSTRSGSSNAMKFAPPASYAGHVASVSNPGAPSRARLPQAS